MDWNVVVTTTQGGMKRAWKALAELGPIARTEFLNVLVMRVDDRASFLEDVHGRMVEDLSLAKAVGHVAPAAVVFSFQSPEQFEKRAREAVDAWLSLLAGKSFHVRMHRRGFKGKLSSMDEERFLAEHLLAILERRGEPGRVDFEDPDFVLAVETVGNRAGLSLWSRQERERYAFLKLD